MRYTIHLQSLDIGQEEYDELKKIGFPNWIFEQAELRNIYMEDPPFSREHIDLKESTDLYALIDDLYDRFGYEKIQAPFKELGEHYSGESQT